MESRVMKGRVKMEENEKKIRGKIVREGRVKGGRIGQREKWKMAEA